MRLPTEIIDRILLYHSTPSADALRASPFYRSICPNFVRLRYYQDRYLPCERVKYDYSKIYVLELWRYSGYSSESSSGSDSDEWPWFSCNFCMIHFLYPLGAVSWLHDNQPRGPIWCLLQFFFLYILQYFSIYSTTFLYIFYSIFLYILLYFIYILLYFIYIL